MRSCRLYQSDNSALDAMVAETAQMLKRLLEMLGAVHLAAVEDQIFLTELRIRMKKLEQELLDQLLAELARHDIGGFSFHTALDPQDVKTLGRALAAATDPSQPRAALAARLSSLSGMELAGRYRFRVKGGKLAVRAPVGEIFRRGATVVQDALGRLGAGRLPHPLLVRRAVIDLVDALGDGPGRAAVLPLTQVGLDVGTRHLLGVTSLALGMGRALGLSDSALSDLGVTAMLHDVGYTRTADRAVHEVAGARLLLRQRGFHEGKIRRLQATLEHHLPAEAKPSLFARVLRIVDDYDVLTAPRPGTLQLPPPTAQASMWAARGTLYDADLLALFVQMMGLYPPGSLLELSDGRWVVVVSGGRDAEHFA